MIFCQSGWGKLHNLAKVTAYFTELGIPHPELQIAGRFPTAATLAHIRHQWGFDQPVYVRYLTIMKLVFTGKIISYTQQVNVVQQLWILLPVTASLAIGAGPAVASS